LAEALDRPAFLPAPAFLIKLLLGEFGRSLLSSQRVVPEKLQKSGYRFTYPDIKSAVDEIVKHRPSSGEADSNQTYADEAEKV
jgi:NAD dependent epimerase/dehydratase family enzyme